MKRTIFILIVFINACNHVNETNYPVLYVDISKISTPSIFDIFKKIEIIPLETNENSLISGIFQIDFHNNHYYIYGGNYSFFCFDERGKFVRKIGKNGPGPEEYLYASKFSINKNNDIIELLNVWGMLYSYEVSGKFVNKITLPNLVPNYQDIVQLNDSIRIFKSITDHNVDQLYVFSIQSNSLVNSFYKEDPAISAFQIGNFFYEYNNCTYFYTPLRSSVFKIDQHGYEPTYSWDFGSLNPDKIKFDKDITNEKLFRMYEINQIKILYVMQSQNVHYYYTGLASFANRISENEYTISYMNVFYNKRDNKIFVFEKFKEDLYFQFPLFWCDEYVLSASNIFDIKRAVDPDVLDEENRKKLESIDEEDNPFLVKYYFK